MDKEQRIKKSMEILEKIDRLLNQLEKVDPYGDMLENFKDMMGDRHTQRLLSMLEIDLKEKRFGGSTDTPLMRYRKW